MGAEEPQPLNNAAEKRLTQGEGEPQPQNK